MKNAEPDGLYFFCFINLHFDIFFTIQGAIYKLVGLFIISP